MAVSELLKILVNSFSYQVKKLNIARQRAKEIRPLIKFFIVRLYVFFPSFEGNVLGFGLSGRKISECLDYKRVDKKGYHLQLKIPLGGSNTFAYYLIRNVVVVSLWLGWILFISYRIKGTSSCLFSSPSCVTSRFLALVTQERNGTASLIEHGGERRFFVDSTHWSFIDSAFSQYVFMKKTDIPDIRLEQAQMQNRIVFVLPSYIDHVPVAEDERPSFDEELSVIGHFIGLCNDIGKIPTVKVHPKGGRVVDYIKNYFDSREMNVHYQSDKIFFESDLFVFLYCGSLWVELLNKECKTLYIDVGARRLSEEGRALFIGTDNYLVNTASDRDPRFKKFISGTESGDELAGRFKCLFL